MLLTGTATSGNRPDHLHIGRLHLEVPRDTNCPGKFASCESPAERRAQPCLPTSASGQRPVAAPRHSGPPPFRRIPMRTCDFH
jgi:hypothetical protein